MEFVLNYWDTIIAVLVMALGLLYRTTDVAIVKGVKKAVEKGNPEIKKLLKDVYDERASEKKNGKA